MAGNNNKGLQIAVLAGGGVIVAGLVIIAVTVLVFTTVVGGVSTGMGGMLAGSAATAEKEKQKRNNGCNEIGSGGGDAGNVVATTSDQKGYVREMIGVAKENHISKKGQIVAVMVMLQESSIKNLGNSGQNINNFSIDQKWLDFAKMSKDLPNDGMGNDADSVGLFQQRASAEWANSADFTVTAGSSDADGKKAVERLMNPAFSAAAFFGVDPSVKQGLQGVPGWESMEPTVAAQKVQGSAFPEAYAKWEDQATKMVDENQDAPAKKVGDTSKGGDAENAAAIDSQPGSTVHADTALDHGQNNLDIETVDDVDKKDDSGGDKKSDDGTIKLDTPLKEGSYKLSSGFGHRDIGPVAGQDVSDHTGQDFEAAEGTPIYAPADGTVRATGLPTGNPADGPWLIIDHTAGGKKWSTEYAHMPIDGGTLVKEGDKVKKGDKIAIVGQSGWATGPHLHFEVWDGGRLDGGHPIDPMQTLNGKGSANPDGGDGKKSGDDGAATAECATNAGNSDDAGSSVKASGDAKEVIEAGKKQLGLPYSWGGGELDGPGTGFGPGEGVKGFDCSSLVRYMIYQGTNKQTELPRVADAQYTATKGNTVAKPGDGIDKLQPGDLMFWGGSEPSIHHVAMYVGDGKLIEAPQPGEDIHITEAKESMGGDFFAATRVDYKKK